MSVFTFTVVGDTFKQGLKAAMAATTKELYLPLLAGVWMGFDTTHLGFSATDRYILVEAVHEIEGSWADQEEDESDAGGLWLSKEFCNLLVSALAPKDYYIITVRIDGDDRYLEVSTGEMPPMLSYKSEPSGSYPKIAHILSAGKELQEGVTTSSFGAEVLGKLLKTLAALKMKGYVSDIPDGRVTRFYGTEGPTSWRLFGAYMPRRTRNESEQIMAEFSANLPTQLLP